MTPGMATLATGKNGVRFLRLHILESRHGGSEVETRFLQHSISEPTNAGSLLQTLVLNDLCKDLNRSVMKDSKESNLNISQCLKSPGGGSQDMWKILTEELDKKRGQNLSLQH